jgi:RNA polymerase sigma factor (sigma-70 family)
MSRNDIIGQHYVQNYDRLVKRTTWKAPNQSKAVAEECVQEAYTRALKYYATFDEKKDDFNKWFEGILRNVLNDVREIERDRGVSKELMDDDGSTELVPYRREKSTADVVLRDMKKNTHRQVLSMFLLYGYKTRDIAEYTGLSHSNVRQIIHRYRNDMYGVYSKNKY